MLPYTIVPTVHIGPLHISMYGVLFAVGILTVYYVAKYIARKRGVDKNIISDLIVYLVFSGIIGARILYVSLHLNEFVQNPLDILKIWEGGLAYFGGLIAALIVGYVYARKKKLDFFLFADLLVLLLIIGHIFGRIGDYLTGGHPGITTNLPWAIFLENAFRHPVVLYEILGLLMILGILFFIQNRVKKGELFLIYIMLYSIQRFALDFFRDEISFYGLKSAQFITPILFIIAFVILVMRRKKGA